MIRLSRRRFHAATAAAAGSFLLGQSVSAAASRRELPFTMDLVPGAIGVRANQREAVALANKHGFKSLAPDSRFLSELSDTERSELLAELKEKNLKWGAAGLPVEFRRDSARFRDDLKSFPKLARGLQAAGVTRVGTYIRPFHGELTYLANFKQHTQRLGACVQIMADHGLRFGMEYVGTKTLWTSTRHGFIHSMAETKELIAAIGKPNVGFVLDSWHWYTAGETAADLRTLKNSDIVACDLNDAPRGIAVDQQIDNQRELPAATGVIDVRSFLSVLAEIGYDGPIRSEPFNAKLNKMDNDAACAATATAMRKAFAMVQQ